MTSNNAGSKNDAAGSDPLPDSASVGQKTKGGLRRRHVLQSAAVALSPLGKPAIARTIRLIYWSPNDPKADDARARGESAMIEIFRKNHPGIAVEIQHVPWQMMGQQVVRAVIAGTGPDVAQLSSTNLPDQVAADTIVPLNNYVGRNWSDNDRHFLLPWSNLTYDGHVMAAYWSSLLNNEFWYLDAGLQGPLPENWSDLSAWLKSGMGEQGNCGFITGLSPHDNGFGFCEWLIPALWACGADYVKPDGGAAFNTGAGAAPFEWLVDLVKQGTTPGVITSMTRDNVLDAMKLRKSVSTILSSNVTATARSALGDTLKIARQPGPHGFCPSFVSGKTVVITKSCAELEAAGLLIESMVSAEAQLANAKLAAEIPVRRSVLKDPFFQTAIAADIRFALKYMSDLPHPFRYPQRGDYLQSRLALAVRQMVDGRSVTEALHHAADDWEGARKA